MTETAVIALLISMVCLSLAVCFTMLFIFAQITGWHGLAKRYGVRDGMQVTPYRTDGVVLGSLGFNSPPLRVGIGAQGVTLRPIRPFRPIFAPLLIPWDEIVSAERKRYMFFEALLLHLSGAKIFLGFTSCAAEKEIERRLPVPISPSP